MGPTLTGENYAHRSAWVLTNGPIPEGMTIDHRCHSESDCRAGRDCPHRRCIEPAHLRLLTLEENLESRRYCVRSHCPKGHEFAVVGRTKQGLCRACGRLATLAWLAKGDNRERQNAMRNARRLRAADVAVYRSVQLADLDDGVDTAESLL
jgi:hypothetical protein